VNRQLIETCTGAVDESSALDEGEMEVLCWRLEQLQRAGYLDELAYAIAEDNRIDLHRACELVANGCPPPTAYRILS
jgi:hypothetical protein